MEQIEHFFECILPTTICNIKCEYCYIIQEGRRNMRSIPLDYSVEHILNALLKSRLGGSCYFSICGAGETLLQEECIGLVHGLLKEGHYVNITTNGILKNKLMELMSIEDTYLERLHVSFSFHYLELQKRNMIDLFFSNVNYVKNLGCSILVQFNLYDGYLDSLDDIKKMCKDRIGSFPQVALTRKEVVTKNGITEVKLHTSLNREQYEAAVKSFDSPLFDFTYKNFNVKRSEFCYAGDWSGTLDLKTGILRPCYNSPTFQNLFTDIHKPVKYRAIGKNCNSIYCFNSSHFLSLGVIPSLSTPSYAQLRNRSEANWYNPVMANVLNKQFKDYKGEYTLIKKIESNLIEKVKLSCFGRGVLKIKGILINYDKIKKS